MLSTSTLNQVLVQAGMLSEQGLQLFTPSNSVLFDLLQSSHPEIDHVNIPETDSAFYDRFFQDVELITSSPTSDHTQGIGALLDQLEGPVTQHIAFAKNTVAPSVKRFQERLAGYLKAFTFKQAGDDFELKIFKTPEVLQDENFRARFAPPANWDRQIPDTYLNLPQRTQEQILPLLVTGSSRFDASISEFVLSQEPGWLECVWSAIFSDGQSVHDRDTSKGYATLTCASPQENAGVSLVVYLIASNLLKDAPEGLRLTLAQFEELAIQVRDTAAGYVLGAINRIAEANSGNVLVWGADINHRKVSINGDLYANWLEKGGTPEILLGAAATGNIVTGGAQLLERQEEFTKAWANYSLLFDGAERAKKVDAYRRLALQAFEAEIHLPLDEELEVRQASANFAESRIDQVAKIVEGLYLKDLECLDTLSLHLVAGVRFDYTSAGRILKDMREAECINPNIDPRDAALLAITNYVADWLTEQVGVAVL